MIFSSAFRLLSLNKQQEITPKFKSIQTLFRVRKVILILLAWAKFL